MYQAVGVLTLGVYLFGCGASASTSMSTTPPAPSDEPSAELASVAEPPPVQRESAECRDKRLAILARMGISAQTPCNADSDCRVVTNPGSSSREYNRVVHAQDAPTLERESRAHIERCGEFHHHESTNAVAVVEPACVQSACIDNGSTLHIPD